VSGQLHAPAALPPGEIAPATHFMGGCAGLRHNGEEEIDIIIIIIIIICALPVKMFLKRFTSS
jgi:hypothetical protein